ncbi:MAG: hypothetical protein SFY56_09600 [Bacteroidota bacterium]|nr:hypothetical protein [Bacteroidota bacterium]
MEVYSKNTIKSIDIVYLKGLLSEHSSIKTFAFRTINEMNTIITKSDQIIEQVSNFINSYEIINKENSEKKQSQNSRLRKQKINWGSHIIESLKENNCLMSSKQILNDVFPKLKTDESKVELRPLLSSVLYKLCDKERIIKYSLSSRTNYFGLFEWFEESNGPFESPKPKIEYAF